ncbi:MAG: hypothetical protein O7H41_18985 [Planctomycetota bacterium]|nr:hypothetical protein [Planctomycetota bacterium]
MDYEDPVKDRKRKEKERRRKIGEAVAEINATPSRVEIDELSGAATAVIRRIPLKLYTEDFLWDWSSWVVGLGLGIFFGLPAALFLVTRTLGKEFIASQSSWIIFPLGLALGVGLWYLLRLIFQFRYYGPNRIRVHAGRFFFDAWNGKHIVGVVAANSDETILQLRFSDGFLEDGWVALDINVATSLVGFLVHYAREAYRMKLDDAAKLIDFGRANRLSVSVDDNVSRLLRPQSRGQTSDG